MSFSKSRNMLAPLDTEINKPAMAQQQSLDACCTCATLLSSVLRFHPGTEKPLPDDRQLSCCDRVICGSCIYNNPRFSSYCPYCQTPSSSSSSSTPANPRSGPKYRPAHHHRVENEDNKDDDTLPPPYPGPTAFNNPLPPPSSSESPPPYSTLPPSSSQPPAEQKKEKIPDTIHHLLPSDTLPSLSLRYSIPLPILLSHNNLPLFSLSTSSSPFHSSSSALLFARGRRTISIPGEYNPSGISLSPNPVESDEEIERKRKIRKWMMTTKVADYDVAVLYMEGNGWDVERAVEALRDDERWEREHPLRDTGGVKGKGKEKGRMVGRTWISGVKRLVPAATGGSGGGNGSVPGGK
ncbi:hypothetical protein B0T20DRAFT_392116 [Sordaria brevicollis]|uniref:Uncharacterized protein n=1 Tax=Sordaria brevicollis TaxID=83679 RepID=A0AAE0PFR2_SORBR|nr:hypothetical protein B0T20DRAFT_392116 [Sordaria brevicollis]